MPDQILLDLAAEELAEVGRGVKGSKAPHSLRCVRVCPECGGGSEVQETQGSYRRRRCSDCGHTYHTREVMMGDVPTVEEMANLKALGSGMIDLLTAMFDSGKIHLAG